MGQITCRSKKRDKTVKFQVDIYKTKSYCEKLERRICELQTLLSRKTKVIYLGILCTITRFIVIVHTQLNRLLQGLSVNSFSDKTQ